jgi:ribosomal protein L14E/L6E/L27E
MEPEDLIGRVVVPKSGRDAGAAQAVVGVAPDGERLLVADGRRRPVEKPKKKNMKHLRFTDVWLEDARSALLAGGALANRQLRKLLDGARQALDDGSA